MFKREVSPFTWKKERGKNNLIYCVVWAWSSPVIASSWPHGSGLMGPVLPHSCHAPASDGLKQSRDKFDGVMLWFPSVWMASALLFSLNTNAQRRDTNGAWTRSSPQVPSTLSILWFCGSVVPWFCDFVTLWLLQGRKQSFKPLPKICRFNPANETHGSGFFRGKCQYVHLPPRLYFS